MTTNGTVNEHHQGGELLHHVSSVSAVADLGKSLLQEEQQTRTNFMSSALGARVLFATDEWFAAADNLLNDAPPIFDANAFCIEGKVMDGWETRRRRNVGHDFCIVRLSGKVAVDEIVVDTAYFTGNFVPSLSIQSADMNMHESVEFVQQVPGALQRLVNSSTSISYQGTAATLDEIAVANETTHAWETVVPVTPLKAGYDESRYHTIYTSGQVATHLRINSFPDGGIARIRVYGRPLESTTMPRCLHPPSLPYAVPHCSTEILPSQTMESKELTLGGEGVDCSNQHYGSPVKLLQETYGKDMGDGWETARHLNRPLSLELGQDDLVDFGTLNDWCIFSLGVPARLIRTVIVDTKHFRGNFPESAIVEGRDQGDWETIVPRSRLAPDAEHFFEVNVDRPTREIRVTIFPDGGLSRVRIYGEPLQD